MFVGQPLVPIRKRVELQSLLQFLVGQRGVPPHPWLIQQERAQRGRSENPPTRQVCHTEGKKKAKSMTSSQQYVPWPVFIFVAVVKQPAFFKVALEKCQVEAQVLPYLLRNLPIPFHK